MIKLLNKENYPMPLPLLAARFIGGALFRRQARSAAFNAARRGRRGATINGSTGEVEDWDGNYSDDTVRVGRFDSIRQSASSAASGIIRGGGRAASLGARAGMAGARIGGRGIAGAANYATGNNFVGRTFAGIGSLVLGRGLNFSEGKDDQKMRKTAKKLARRNNKSEEEIYQDLLFDKQFGTKFATQDLRTSRGLLGLGRERLVGLSSRESKKLLANNSGSGESAGGSIVASSAAGKGVAISSGKAASVMLLPSPGVSAIVDAQAATTGAVQSSGKDLFQAISGTSKVLQASDGKFKEGNPGGKSAIVKELKKNQTQLAAIKTISEGDKSETEKTNDKLSKIVFNTSPDITEKSSMGMQMMLMDGNTLSRQGNQLVERSNKFLAYIAKALGMRAEAPRSRRKEAIVGMMAMGAAGMIGTEVEERFPEFQKKIDELMQWATNAMKPFIDAIDKSVTPALNWIGDKFKKVAESEKGQDVKGAFKTLVEDIKNSGFMQVLKPVIDALKALGRAVGAILNLFYTVGKVFLKTIYTVFIKPFGVVLRGVIKAVAWVVEKVSNIIEFFANAATKSWEAIDAVITPLLEAFDNFARWLRNSWFGKMMGYADTHNISVVAKAYLGDDKKVDKLIEKQDKIIGGIEYSNKQRQQLDERNRKIMETEQQKNRELTKEQIDMIKKVSATSTEHGFILEKQLRTQNEQLALQRKPLEGNAMFDIGDDGYVQINDALRQAALHADYDWTGYNFASSKELEDFKTAQAESLSTAIINNLKILSSEEYGAIKGKDGLYNISIDPEKWGKNDILGVNHAGFFDILSQGGSYTSFVASAKKAKELGFSEYNYIDDNSIKYLTKQAYSGDVGAMTVLDSLMKSMDINNTKREEIRAEKQKKATEEGKAKIQQEFASEEERINHNATKAMEAEFDQSIIKEAGFFAEKAMKEGVEGLKKILPEGDIKYDEFVKEVKEGKAVDAYQKFILGIDETMLMNNVITQKGNEMIVEQLKKIEENTKKFISDTAYYDSNGVTTSAITSGASMRINGFVDKAKAGVGHVTEGAKTTARKIKSKVTGKGSGDDYTSTATTMSNIDSSDLDLNTQEGREELLRRHLASQGYDHQSTAALMAHAKHESGQFKHMIEQGKRSYFDKYEQGKLAQRLGNTQKGDGYKFRGRGYVQLTGRDNYTRAGKALGLDLANHPELAEDPHNAVRIYEWFIKTKRHGETKEKMMDLIQSGEFRKSTYALNGGYNGWDDRLSSYNSYLKDENLHKAPETIKQESMVADVKKPDMASTPLIYKRNEEAPSKVLAEASSDGMVGTLGSVTRRYNDAIDRKNKETMQTAIMAMPQPQPVVVNAGGGNGGSTTNVVNTTDESIHFAGDIPAAIAQRTLASGFA